MIRRNVLRMLLAVAAGLVLWCLQAPAAANACGPSYQGDEDSSLHVGCPQTQPEWAAGVLAALAGTAAATPLLLGFLKLAAAGGQPRKVIPVGGNQFRLNNPGQIKGIGKRVLDPGFLSAPNGMRMPPPGGQPFDPALADQVEAWGLNDVKTRGLLVRGNGQIMPLRSGLAGPARTAPGGPGTGLNFSVRSHVEAHAGTALQPGESGTLYLNRLPCGAQPGSAPGCEQSLPRYVSPGASLTVYGPDGYSRLVIGGQP